MSYCSLLVYQAHKLTGGGGGNFSGELLVLREWHRGIEAFSVLAKCPLDFHKKEKWDSSTSQAQMTRQCLSGFKRKPVLQ